MQNFHLMQSHQPFDHLDNNLPDVLLLHELLDVLALTDSLENIAIVCKLHYNANNNKNQRRYYPLPYYKMVK